MAFAYSLQSRTMVYAALYYTIPFMQSMMGSKLKTPKIYAIYDKNFIHYLSDMTILSDETAIIKYLTSKAIYPLFMKPDDGMLRESAASIHDYDEQSRELVYINGDKELVASFAQKIDTLNFNQISPGSL